MSFARRSVAIMLSLVALMLVSGSVAAYGVMQHNRDVSAAPLTMQTVPAADLAADGITLTQPPDGTSPQVSRDVASRTAMDGADVSGTVREVALANVTTSGPSGRTELDWVISLPIDVLANVFHPPILASATAALRARIVGRLDAYTGYEVGFVDAMTGQLNGFEAAAHAGPVTLAAGPAQHFRVIVSGLNNPRSLASASDRILVSEAGTGGPYCFGTGNGKTCYGLTGAIAAIQVGTSKASVWTVAPGLISVSGANGVTGPDGVAYSSVSRRIYTVETGSSATVPQGLPPEIAGQAYNQLGRVLDVTPGNQGQYTMVGDPGDFDFAWSNQHKILAPRDFPDANPYALTVTSNTVYLNDAAFVVDAGSNTFDVVVNGQHPGLTSAVGGFVRVLAQVPNPPVGDAVPTCIAQGKDRSFYIGELTAAGNKAGSADIYRWNPFAKSPHLTVWKRGFSAVTGCGFGTNGDFYVTEFDTTGFPPMGRPAGAVVQIAPSGKRTVLGKGKLFAPSGFLAGPGNSFYVANWSVASGRSSHGSPTGQVVQITP